jgi:hypothetical protein
VKKPVICLFLRCRWWAAQLREQFTCQLNARRFRNLTQRDGTITTNADVLPGCFWIKPLLSAIEKANNQLAGIQREKQSLKGFSAIAGTIETEQSLQIYLSRRL